MGDGEGQMNLVVRKLVVESLAKPRERVLKLRLFIVFFHSVFFHSPTRK